MKIIRIIFRVFVTGVVMLLPFMMHGEEPVDAKTPPATLVPEVPALEAPNDVQTLARSIKQGGKISLKPGTYFLPKNVMIAQDVTIIGESEDASQTIIEVEPALSYQRLKAPNITFQRLTFRVREDASQPPKKRLSDMPEFTFSITDGTLTLRQCVFSHFTVQLRAESEKAAIVAEECRFSHGYKHSVGGKGRCDMKNCEFFDNEYVALSAEINHFTMEKCKFYRNYMGLDIRCKQTTITDCEFYEHRSCAIGAVSMRAPVPPLLIKNCKFITVPSKTR